MLWLIYLLAAVALIAAGLLLRKQRDRRLDEAACQSLIATQSKEGAVFELPLVAELPEPARRYFAFVITPGTPIRTVASIEMTGELGTGTKAAPHYRAMNAEQILAPPHGLVWKVSSGPLSGSDGLMPDASWTRFWLFNLIPVVRAKGADHHRSAFGRAIAEAAIWALRTVNRVIETVLKPVSALLIALMLATVMWGVISRLTGISAPWTDKVMLIMLPALAFLVAPVAYRRSANVALDLLRDALSPRARNVHGLVMHLAILLLLMVGLDLTLRKVGIDPGPLSTAIRTLTGLDLTEIRPFAMPMRVPVIGIQWSQVYTVMPIGIALMIVANIELLLRHTLAIFDRDNRFAQPVRTIEESESRLWD